VMPGHLRVPGLTGELPATLSAAALTGLLRGELGFTGVIISDALEMRAVRGVYGLAETAVRAVAAGTDLLCLGRDTSEEDYLAVRRALTDAVADGRLPATRLEEAQRSVAGLRTWLAGQRRPDGGHRAQRAHIGLVAARRAIHVSAAPRPLADPVVLQLGAPENIAVGSVPWGLAPWVPASRLQRAPASLADGETAAVIGAALAQADGGPLVVVLRDAHRHPAAQAVVTGLLAARPDVVVVDMGLPFWAPPGGLHVATYGAARVNAQAAAEVLGLTR
jgi:beta-N-acetylhexosaminidase